MPAPLRFSVLLGALLALLGGSPGAAVAAPGDVTVPNVTGSAADVARQTLEAQSLSVDVVTVAGPAVGRVDRQDPPAGARVPTGTEVTLRVGIALRVETRLPDLRGSVLSDVGADLEGAYVLEVELVPGPADQDGRIVEQNPAAGQTLWYRGVLALRVVHAAGSGGAGAVVPVLIGRTEAEALDVLQALGLSAAVEYVEDPAHAVGTVLSQLPASGTQMLSGGTVSLRIAGTPNAPPPAPGQGAPAPSLVGLDMNAALLAVQAAGFVPQCQFSAQGGGTPWSCVEQSPPAGTPLAPGSVLVLRIALPASAPAQVTVPTLFGLTQVQASQLVGSLGLVPQVQQVVSGFPAGLVFAQGPKAGAVVPAGSPVKLVVALPPPGGWTPQQVPVPNVVGLPAAQAFQALQAAGLSPKAKQHLAPNQPVDVVDAQSPLPGAQVPPGSEARFYVPVAGLVPTLIGKSKNDAIQILQAAGFNPQPQGPAFGLGGTVVIAQGATAGVPLARGSDVAFAYKFQVGGGIGAKVQVPNLAGMAKNAAAAALQQQGLGADLQHQGPFLPGTGTKVVSQGPPAGAMVNPGTVVQVVYVDVAVGPPALAQVPTLVGLSVPDAQQALAAAGLQGQFQQQGPNLPGGGTKITTQQPSAGQVVPKGSSVQATFVQTLPGGPKAQVPTLVGLTLPQAQQALAAQSLQGNFVLQGAPHPGGPTKVISQQTPANVLVPKGTTITAVYLQSPAPPPAQVSIPNVVGMKRQDARATLEALGLVVNFVGVGPPNKQKAVNQNPGVGAQVAPGSTVTVTVVAFP